jgi:hypothetical protein
MRIAFALLLSIIAPALALAACGGGGSAPNGACSASDPACDPGQGDSATVVDARPDSRDSASEATEMTATDATADVSDACMLWVDDAGVTQGCGAGGMGQGDRDDGGGGPPPPPPDAALDASNLAFGASCWDNAQCASYLCFDYRARGQFCSQVCTMNDECPSTSPGCNGMGVCRQAGGGM